MMSQEERVRMGTIVLVERYRAWMRTKGIEPIRSPDGKGLPHVHWMLGYMHYALLNEDHTFDLYKASRWLGFAQNEIIEAGWTTVEAERNYSRILFKGNAVVPPMYRFES